MIGKGNKTAPITFNLKDRGRQHTGQSRNNVDIQAWINLINSPKTQESVKNGDLLGYIGHELRVLYGMAVPDMLIDPTTNRILEISPAVKTIYLSCDQEGNVTHQQEFLDTPEGQFAKRQYVAQIGKFSAATSKKTVNGLIIPTQMHGFDVVKMSNYATNKGNGELLDSIMLIDEESEPMFDSAQDLPKTASELAMLDSIFNFYDVMQESNFHYDLAERNAALVAEKEKQIEEIRNKSARRKQLIQERNDEMLDSALCPTKDIDDYLKEQDGFLLDSVAQGVEVAEDFKEDKPKKVVNMFGYLGGIFGGNRGR